VRKFPTRFRTHAAHARGIEAHHSFAPRQASFVIGEGRAAPRRHEVAQGCPGARRFHFDENFIQFFETLRVSFGLQRNVLIGELRGDANVFADRSPDADAQGLLHGRVLVCSDLERQRLGAADGQVGFELRPQAESTGALRRGDPRGIGRRGLERAQPNDLGR
jgi:hypothetical protein